MIFFLKYFNKKFKLNIFFIHCDKTEHVFLYKVLIKKVLAYLCKINLLYATKNRLLLQVYLSVA